MKRTFFEYPTRLDVAHVPGRPLASDLTLWGLTSYLAKMLAEKVTPAQANEYASLPHGCLCIDWILTFGRLLAASSTTL